MGLTIAVFSSLGMTTALILRLIKYKRTLVIIFPIANFTTIGEILRSSCPGDFQLLQLFFNSTYFLSSLIFSLHSVAKVYLIYWILQWDTKLIY